MVTGPISVVVPVGQVDEVVSLQLRALSEQDIDADFDVVVVCNTESTTSLRRLDDLVREIGDQRFGVVHAPHRRGAAHARNVGAAAGHGTTLAFCDADDVVDRGWLAALTRALDDADAVGGRLIDTGLTPRQQRARPPTTPGRLPEFFGVPYMVSANMAVSREAFERVGGFDETLIRCEDIALSWQLIVAGYRIAFAADAQVTYRHRSGVGAMVRQHVAYGRGMGQLLVGYGIPDGDGWIRPTGPDLLRPNPSSPQRTPSGEHRSIPLVLLRRSSLAIGRTVGVLEAWRRRPG